MANDKNMKQVVGIVERGEGDDKKSYWTRIGVAFTNKDGSMNLKLDFLPTIPGTTIQVRDMDPKKE